MTSFDCRLKAIKACSACGNLHTSAFCCSKEKLKNKILVPMPESSQQHIKIERICFDCGDLLHGLNCLECDLTRKILEKAFQKFQNTSKSSNDNSNVVNAPREPFVVKQDPSFLLADRSDISIMRSSPMNSLKSESQPSMIVSLRKSLLGNFTMDVVGNIFQTKEPRVHVLNVLPTLELDFIPSSESIFAYVVWIFLPFLSSLIPPYLSLLWV
ncbi:hypothetical protein Tco_0393139 [Tanacetum coccineum]